MTAPTGIMHVRGKITAIIAALLPIRAMMMSRRRRGGPSTGSNSIPCSSYKSNIICLLQPSELGLAAGPHTAALHTADLLSLVAYCFDYATSADMVSSAAPLCHKVGFA